MVRQRNRLGRARTCAAVLLSGVQAGSVQAKNALPRMTDWQLVGVSVSAVLAVAGLITIILLWPD